VRPLLPAGSSPTQQSRAQNCESTWKKSDMKRPFFKFALATLTTCGLASLTTSAVRGQSEGPFGTLVPVPPIGSSSSTTPLFGPPGTNGRFSPSANRMFGNQASQIGNSPWQFGNAPLGIPLGDISVPYGTPGAYSLYNGNGVAVSSYLGGVGPSYVNSGGGYLNNDVGYRGYGPYYGNNGGYGMNYGVVNLGPYGNYAVPVYYGNGSYNSMGYGNGYTP
jgi:hypothetical protein